MASASSLLDTRRPLGEPTSKVFPMRIQIYHNGKQFKISPKDEETKEPLSATTTIYDKYKNDKCNCSASRKLKKQVDKELQKCNEIFNVLKSFSPDGFKKLYNSQSGIRRKATTTLLKELFNQKIAVLIENEKFNTASNYRSSLNNILAFCREFYKQSPDDVVLEDVTVDWLNQFQRWNLTKGNNNIADPNSKNSKKKLKYHRIINGVRTGNQLGTVKCYVRCLQSIFNDAIAERLIASTAYPFGKRQYSVGGVAASKQALTQEQVTTLQAYDGRYNDVRDMWLFLYYGNGMNITDAMHIKWKDIYSRDGGEWFTFRRKKTQFSLKESFPITVFVSSHVKKILHRNNGNNSPYVFNVLKATMNPQEQHKTILLFKGNVNQRLKSLGKQLGFHINLKMARATFATMLRDRGTPIAVISKLLGHSSIATTEIYLASLPNDKAKEAAKELEEIWINSEAKNAIIGIDKFTREVKAIFTKTISEKKKTA